RIGLLLDEPKIPWWIAPAIIAARERGIATVALAIIRRAPRETHLQIPRLLRWWKHRSVLGFALLERLERYRTRRDELPGDLLLETSFESIPRLVVEPMTTRFRDAISEADVETIRSYELDVLLRIGFRILRGPILTTARHGTWS